MSTYILNIKPQNGITNPKTIVTSEEKEKGMGSIRGEGSKDLTVPIIFYY